MPAQPKPTPKDAPKGNQKLTMVGNNVGYVINGNKLLIKIDLTADHGDTPKGFRRIASTRGNIVLEGTNAKLGLNMYAPRE